MYFNIISPFVGFFLFEAKQFDSGFISEVTETDLSGISFMWTFGNLSRGDWFLDFET